MINQYKKIVGIIALCAYLCLPRNAFSQQCPTSPLSSASFSINGKVTVTGDGNGIGSADNNKALTICLNQSVILENKTPGLINAGYRFYDNVTTAFPAAGGKPANPTGVLAYSVDNLGISNITDFNTKGFVTGILVMDGSSGGIRITACQVVKIIKPQAPKVSIPAACANGIISIKLENDPANIFDSYQINYTKTATGNKETPQDLPYPITIPSIHSSKKLDPESYDVTVIGFNRIDEPLVGSTCPTTASAPINIIPKAGVLKRIEPSTMEGTTVAGEYVIKFFSGNEVGTKVNIYQREESGSYDFSKPALKIFNTNFKVPITIKSDSIKFTVAGPADKVYCFKMDVVDDCPTATPLINLARFDICTPVMNVVAEDNKNVIKWSKFPSGTNLTYKNYTIEYYDSLTSKWNILPGGAITDINNLGPLEHTDIECGKKYSYRVTADAGPSASSTIKEVTAISATIPNAADVIFASLNDKADSVRIQCEWKDQTTKPKNILSNSFRVWRADSPTGTYSVVNTGNRYFDDGTFNVNEESKCYYMDYSNLCGVYSEKTKTVCSILAKNVGESMSWTGNSPVGEGVAEYRIELIDPATGTPDSSRTAFFPYVTSKTFLDAVIPDDEKQTLYIRVQAFPIGFNTTTGRNTFAQSNIIKIFRPTVASFAQVFTPNGDNFNDKFGAYVKRYKFVVKAQMQVYDRWGNIIYSDSTTDKSELDPSNPNPGFGWDGKMKDGTYANEGTYAFRMIVEDQSGQTTTKDGVVLLAYKQP
jgi:gliding motility-associated-like protein